MNSFNDLLRNCIDFDSLSGSSLAEIRDAELQLDVSFSSEYRQYLQEFGIASANGHEFTGICNSPRLNVVAVTKEAKKNNAAVPHGYYVVERTGIDGIVIWQECSGNILMTKPHSIPVSIGDSLSDFFAESLQEQ